MSGNPSYYVFFVLSCLVSFRQRRKGCELKTGDRSGATYVEVQIKVKRLDGLTEWRGVIERNGVGKVETVLRFDRKNWNGKGAKARLGKVTANWKKVLAPLLYKWKLQQGTGCSTEPAARSSYFSVRLSNSHNFYDGAEWERTASCST